MQKTSGTQQQQDDTSQKAGGPNTEGKGRALVEAIFINWNGIFNSESS